MFKISAGILTDAGRTEHQKDSQECDKLHFRSSCWGNEVDGKLRAEINPF